MKYHAIYAIIAVTLFIGHLVANLYIDVLHRLPEYVWLCSIPFALLAAYSGIMTACRNEPLKRGVAARKVSSSGGLIENGFDEKLGAK